MSSMTGSNKPLTEQEQGRSLLYRVSNAIIVAWYRLKSKILFHAALILSCQIKSCESDLPLFCFKCVQMCFRSYWVAFWGNDLANPFRRGNRGLLIPWYIFPIPSFTSCHTRLQNFLDEKPAFLEHSICLAKTVCDWRPKWNAFPPTPVPRVCSYSYRL